MIEFGISTAKRIYARARNLLCVADETRQFDVHKPGLYPDISRYTKLQYLAPNDIQLLNCLRRQLNDELEPEEAIADQEVLGFALEELQLAITSSRREDKVLRLGFQLWDAKAKR
jgi:hypothetical protein